MFLPSQTTIHFDVHTTFERYECYLNVNQTNFNHKQQVSLVFIQHLNIINLILYITK